MMRNEEVISTLKRVGLNQYESRVYLALLAKGISSAGSVAEIAEIPRSRVYDVLVSLEKKGLVSIQQSKPVRYVPVKPTEIVDRIKLKYEQEYGDKLGVLEKLRKDIDSKLLPIFEKNYSEIEGSTVSTIIRGRENIQRQMQQMISSASAQIYKLTPEVGLMSFAKDHKSHLSAASKKGVATKILTQVSDKNRQDASSLSGIVNLKHLDDLHGRLLVKDGDESFLYISSPEAQEDIGIWVKSPYFAESMQKFFEGMWEKGIAV